MTWEQIVYLWKVLGQVNSPVCSHSEHINDQIAYFLHSHLSSNANFDQTMHAHPILNVELHESDVHIFF